MINLIQLTHAESIAISGGMCICYCIGMTVKGLGYEFVNQIRDKGGLQYSLKTCKIHCNNKNYVDSECEGEIVMDISMDHRSSDSSFSGRSFSLNDGGLIDYSYLLGGDKK